MTGYIHIYFLQCNIRFVCVCISNICMLVLLVSLQELLFSWWLSNSYNHSQDFAKSFNEHSIQARFLSWLEQQIFTRSCAEVRILYIRSLSCVLIIRTFIYKRSVRLSLKYLQVEVEAEEICVCICLPMESRIWLSNVIIRCRLIA